MRALEKKLFRDFARLWAQGLAIALVLACGVSILLMSFGMFLALTDTRAAYYERNRFADVFAALRRAPQSLEPEIASLPGALAFETRVTGNAILDLPGKTEAAVGQFISLPPADLPAVNVPLLRSGRLPDPMASSEVAVNEPFALANGYRPGDVIHANLNGARRPLTITGTVLSPEFIYTIGPGDMMPDNERFGVIWMPEAALAAAFDMVGAFNSVGLKLTRSANVEDVIDRLDALLDPYGGLGAHDRSLQISHAFIDGELKQLKSMAYVLPPVFFGITVFLVNMVIGRIVALERNEIGLMKAIGYSDFDVCLHYLFLSGLIAAVGILAGFGFGTWLARALAQLYAEFFNFPYLIYSISADAYLIAGGLGVLTAGAGAIRSALSAAWLAPAVAMSPPAPPHFRRSWADRLLALFRPSQLTMMILRNILRWPLRAGLTALGLALAVAVLVSSSFFEDALEEMVETAFYKSNRQDAMLILSHEIEATALAEVARLPGAMIVEGQQFHGAILRSGPRQKRVAVEGRPKDADLARIVDSDGRVVPPPDNGILLSTRLAWQLEVEPGDLVTVEFLTGRRETHEVPVAGIVTQYLGLAAYMENEALSRLFRQAPRLGAVNLELDEAATEAFHAAVKDLPGLAGTVMLGDTLEAFQETIEKNIDITTAIYVAIAVLITVGVAYNSARIQLSERARDLASLRILGFSNAEVSYILIGEVLLLALVAQPLGWLLGSALAAAMVNGFESDLYSIPLVLKRGTFTWASVVVLITAAAAALLVRRRLDTLDLVAVMKTRE